MEAARTAAAMQPAPWQAPPADGLYHPALEKEACGVGFVVSIDGARSNKVPSLSLHSFIHSFVHPFIRSFIRSFILSFIPVSLILVSCSLSYSLIRYLFTSLLITFADLLICFLCVFVLFCFFLARWCNHQPPHSLISYPQT